MMVDPRPGQGAEDIRPVVAKAQRRLPAWLLVAAVIAGGVGLFGILEGRRQAALAPAVTPRAAELAAGTMAPPPLFVPADPVMDLPPPPPPEPPSPLTLPVAPSPSVPLTPPPPAPASAPASASPGQAAFASVPPRAAPEGDDSAPVLVIDTTTAPPMPAVAEGGAADAGDNPAVRPGRIRRPSATVIQGTLIPAVLETALDSSRPGQVRAIVSRDIAGFDGHRVLIPRGSRLVGNYEADLTDGQSRAFVEWTRLVRPDGLSIALGSPAADLQGRAGVPGRVNSHFLARFGSALLQTTLNLGASAAGRSLGGESSVVVALPGATQNLGASASVSTIRPTLRVAAGARVSVLVARDLEFSSGTPR